MKVTFGSGDPQDCPFTPAPRGAGANPKKVRT